MERQLARSDRSTDSVTVMIVGFGYIQCARGLYQGDDLEEILIWQDFFLVIVLPKVKNSAKGRVKVYHEMLARVWGPSW